MKYEIPDNKVPLIELLARKREAAMGATLTRDEIETALDSGRLWLKATRSNNRIRVRRNGRTQTWRTRHKEFSIPIKFGFRGYGRVDHSNTELFEVRS